MARKQIERVVVIALDAKGNALGSLDARVKVNKKWFTPKMAKRALKATYPTAVKFIRKKVFKEDT
jgi:hypothetical protein